MGVSVGAMSTSGGRFDYHGALVVIETRAGEIVFIHPPGAPVEAPASLPSNPCAPGEAPADGAVRMAREMTGFGGRDRPRIRDLHSARHAYRHHVRTRLPGPCDWRLDAGRGTRRPGARLSPGRAAGHRADPGGKPAGAERI